MTCFHALRLKFHRSNISEITSVNGALLLYGLLTIAGALFATGFYPALARFLLKAQFFESPRHTFTNGLCNRYVFSACILAKLSTILKR
jgi:hypothetical protein